MKKIVLLLAASFLMSFTQATYSADTQMKPVLGFAYIGISDKPEIISKLKAKKCNLKESGEGLKTYVIAVNCFNDDLPAVTDVLFTFLNKKLFAVEIQLVDKTDMYLKSLSKIYGKPKIEYYSVTTNYTWQNGKLLINLGTWQNHKKNIEDRRLPEYLRKNVKFGSIRYSLPNEREEEKRARLEWEQEQRRQTDKLL